MNHKTADQELDYIREKPESYGKMVLNTFLAAFFLSLFGLAAWFWNYSSNDKAEKKVILKAIEIIERDNEKQDKVIDKNTEELKFVRRDSNDIRINLAKMQQNIINIKDGVDDIKQSIQQMQK